MAKRAGLHALRLFSLAVAGAWLCWRGGAAAAVAADETTTRAPSCYDVIVVARVTGTIPMPYPDHEPNVIVIRWPWFVDLEIDQVVMGRMPLGPRRVTASLHNGLREESFLLALRRSTDGSYRIVHRLPYLVEDRRGRFVIPLAEPLHRGYLRPQGWLPPTYEQWLRPIRYRPREAWWLRDRDPVYDSDHRIDPTENWSRRISGGVLALRGLHVEDLPEMLGDEGRCAASPGRRD